VENTVVWQEILRPAHLRAGDQSHLGAGVGRGTKAARHSGRRPSAAQGALKGTSR
jgi:hypothetical protein